MTNEKTREEIQKRVVEIVAEQLGLNNDEVKPDSDLFEDLGADSLDVVELVMGLEEEFDITVPDEETEGLLTISKIAEYIFDHQGDKQ